MLEEFDALVERQRKCGSGTSRVWFPHPHGRPREQNLMVVMIALIPFTSTIIMPQIFVDVTKEKIKLENKNYEWELENNGLWRYSGLKGMATA